MFRYSRRLRIGCFRQPGCLETLHTTALDYSVINKPTAHPHYINAPLLLSEIKSSSILNASFTLVKRAASNSLPFRYSTLYYCDECISAFMLYVEVDSKVLFQVLLLVINMF